MWYGNRGSGQKDRIYAAERKPVHVEKRHDGKKDVSVFFLHVQVGNHDRSISPQIGVCEHDAFWGSRCAAGILQHGYRVYGILDGTGVLFISHKEGEKGQYMRAVTDDMRLDAWIFWLDGLNSRTVDCVCCGRHDEFFNRKPVSEGGYLGTVGIKQDHEAAARLVQVTDELCFHVQRVCHDNHAAAFQNTPICDNSLWKVGKHERHTIALFESQTVQGSGEAFCEQMEPLIGNA